MPNKTNKLKLSFSTLGSPGWAWRDIVSAASDLGYDGIEVRGVGADISAPSIPQFAESAIPKTLAKLDAMNLVIPCLASEICLHERDAVARTDGEVAAYVKLANALHVPYVRVMGASAVPHPAGGVDEGFVVEQAQRHAKTASEYGVTLLIETNGEWADSEKLARLIQKVNSPSLKALWDIHHPYRYFGEPPRVTVDNLGGYIAHTHFKDSKATGSSVKYAMLGFGDVPYKEAVSRLRDRGYDGFYSLEWVKRWDLTLEEPGVVFAQYANAMRDLG